ncbi:hypothetical protein NXW19_26425 [Bacteroides ovatus]|uniref:helix-turn-helix domain-containing protein n=1 Tax=Bacteroides xylanisolvens TaxID=371601 RepID=UPI002166B881|nr:hypothetical protein [Bacteroides xylanisolvens]MCS2592253.1 hypothetical protein [Bacteroides thetaiotaomicron]MCS3376801.1 hypothetical protein [Bacteroides xylanisolvens]UVP77155.1 hypothetical protein NXW19_26425 [Bacteroides ovatus]
MPSKEYYRKLKKEAHDLYVREGMTCKEISTRINVSERSVSSWINENDALWKKSVRHLLFRHKNRVTT